MALPSLANTRTILTSRTVAQQIAKYSSLRFIGRSTNRSRCLPAKRISRFVVRNQLIRSYSSAQLSRSNHELSSIDPFYLRDSCSCSRCVDSSTRQKLFETSDIPQDLEYGTQERTEDGQLRITWKNDIPGYEGHQSIYKPEFLQDSMTTSARSSACHNHWQYVSWDKQVIEHNLDNITFEYEDYINDTETLWQAIKNLHTYGLVFVKNTPTVNSAIESVANRIGPLKNTFYGLTWNVRSVPSAKNVAYTSSNLDFHMDLLYMNDPPTIQLLHVMKQSTEGGESRFSDGVAAFNRLQAEHPDLVKPLVEYPTTYHYKNDGHWLQQTRYFLEGGETGRSKPTKPHYSYPADYEALNWSPPFQGPSERAMVYHTSKDEQTPPLKDHIRAARKFKDFVAADEAAFEIKMSEGLCAVFNNRRVLHARKPFSTTAGGERLLKGVYVDGDSLRDKYRYMMEQRK